MSGAKRLVIALIGALLLVGVGCASNNGEHADATRCYVLREAWKDAVLDGKYDIADINMADYREECE